MSNDILKKAQENPKDSLEMAIAFGSYDWSTYDRHAWIYGIICGWDDASYKEMAKQHGWSADSVARLKRLHKKFKELK